MDEEKNVKDIRKQVDEQIETIQNETLERGNVDYLYRLVDIKKDFLEIECKEKELKSMRYGRRYDDYEEGRYGRRTRDSRGRYSGEDSMEEMYENYREYRGNSRYGHGEEGIESLRNMLESSVELFEYLQDQSNSPEEMEMIKKYMKKIGNM